MQPFLLGRQGVSIPLFAIASLSSGGAGSELREVRRPFRRHAVLVTALLTNCLAVPMLALSARHVQPAAAVR